MARGTGGKNVAAQETAAGPAVGDRADGQAGVVVAMCAGHRCAALTRKCSDGELGAAVARSRGGVLISAPCLQQCAEGAVGAVAIRSSNADLTGPSLWLGGLDDAGHLQSLARWVEQWRPVQGQVSTLPQDLSATVIGSGPPIRLTAPVR